jgi:DNA-binding GntR family transcriptional regulator
MLEAINSRRHTVESLAHGGEEALAVEFGVSRETVRKARAKALEILLPENVGNKITDN